MVVVISDNYNWFINLLLIFPLLHILVNHFHYKFHVVTKNETFVDTWMISAVSHTWILSTTTSTTGAWYLLEPWSVSPSAGSTRSANNTNWYFYSDMIGWFVSRDIDAVFWLVHLFHVTLLLAPLAGRKAVHPNLQLGFRFLPPHWNHHCSGNARREERIWGRGS